MSRSSSARIILFGSEGGFSRPILKQLLARDVSVVAIVMVALAPADECFPVNITHAVKPGTLEEMALRNKIDILKTQSLNDETFIQQLTIKKADVFLVACFAHKIPDCIWQDMHLPCWNLHPSLLPKYRGPSPLLWQIKHDEINTGLTLHEVSGQFDAGSIIAQISISLPANHDKNVLDGWVAEHGAELFYQALTRYMQSTLSPLPQDEAIATYFPYTT